MNESISYSDFREHLKSTLDKVCGDHMPVLVTRKNGENVIVISESDYRSLDETAYLLNSSKNALRIMQALGESPENRQIFNDINELRSKIGLVDEDSGDS